MDPTRQMAFPQGWQQTLNLPALQKISDKINGQYNQLPTSEPSINGLIIADLMPQLELIVFTMQLWINQK